MKWILSLILVFVCATSTLSQRYSPPDMPFLDKYRDLIDQYFNRQPRGGRPSAQGLIEQGRDLFFNETFNGNGRTCGTCHRAENNLRIDVDFIARLRDPNDPIFSPDDPLFVAEIPLDEQLDMGLFLPPFEPDDPSLPAFEDPFLMVTRGLILENIEGFDRPPVFREVNTINNVKHTAPYGHNGNFADLKSFATGAVEQHFPKTLLREPGIDFRFPTRDELKALNYFMRSNFSPADKNFNIRGNPRGQQTFNRVGCAQCHTSVVLSGRNFATGVEDLPSSMVLPVRDRGAGTFARPAFQAPPLFGLRKPAFFHNNAVIGLRNAVAFYNSAEFADAQGRPGGLRMSEQEIDDITAFLDFLSAPDTLEQREEKERKVRRKKNRNRNPKDRRELPKYPPVIPDVFDDYNDIFEQPIRRRRFR